MGTRKILRSRLLASGIALLGLVFAVACGGGSSNSTAVSSDQLAPPDQQVLRLRVTGEPKSIDPNLTNISSETTLTKSLFAGLFTYDPSLKVVPNEATELPTVDNGGISKDGLTYTVKLKKDAKWSDGQAVTANDFVYSMQRELDPKVAGPYASFYYDLVGAKDYNTALGTSTAPKTPSDTDLAAMRSNVGVSAKDASTIVYHLVQPDPSFLNLLSIWSAFPVRQDVIEKYGSKWTEAGNLIGNGAFVLREWTHDQRIVFEANPYWNGDQPKLHEIIVNFIADDAAAYAAYMNNELDSVVVPAANLKDVLTPGSPLHDQLVSMNDLNTYALFMNNTVTPFDNAKVRQAFSEAIDRDAYVQGLLQGAGQTTTGWIPPGMPGFDSEMGKNLSFNPTQAKQLLADAGYPDGKGLPDITFMLTATDANKLLGQFLQDQLKKNLGVDVQVEYPDSKTRSARFTANQYQATIASWTADWAYPDNWLPDQFGSQALNNHVAYKSAKFDDLAAKAAAETDDKKRIQDYKDAEKVVLDDAAISPMYNRLSFVLVKPKVKSLIITPLDGAVKGDYNFAKTFIAAN